MWTVCAQLQIRSLMALTHAFHEIMWYPNIFSVFCPSLCHSWWSCSSVQCSVPPVFSYHSATWKCWDPHGTTIQIVWWHRGAVPPAVRRESPEVFTPPQVCSLEQKVFLAYIFRAVPICIISFVWVALLWEPHNLSCNDYALRDMTVVIYPLQVSKQKSSCWRCPSMSSMRYILQHCKGMAVFQKISTPLCSAAVLGGAAGISALISLEEISKIPRLNIF